jgi:hypothetical protein
MNFCHFDATRVINHKIYYRKRGGHFFFNSRLHDVSFEFGLFAHGLIVHHFCFNLH